MKTEIAFTLDRQHRVVSQNFWFVVEHRTPLGWKKVGTYRNWVVAVAILENR
jgi:hypothetical protein